MIKYFYFRKRKHRREGIQSDLRFNFRITANLKLGYVRLSVRMSKFQCGNCNDKSYIRVYKHGLSFVSLRSMCTFVKDFSLNNSVVQNFPPIIIIYRGGNFVYHHWVYTSIYRRLFQFIKMSDYKKISI